MPAMAKNRGHGPLLQQKIIKSLTAEIFNLENKGVLI